MKKLIFKRRIDWLMENMGEGKTEEELRQNLTDMIMEDSHTIKNKLIVRPYQFDELIDENGDVPEYGTPEWQENHNISEKYWKEYHKASNDNAETSVNTLTHYLITGKRS
tara:strand:+ start:271 stop:600 length:330 start_codon:yes stop_codon:yes gene_type:complete